MATPCTLCPRHHILSQMMFHNTHSALLGMHLPPSVFDFRYIKSQDMPSQLGQALWMHKAKGAECGKRHICHTYVIHMSELMQISMVHFSRPVRAVDRRPVAGREICHQEVSASSQSALHGFVLCEIHNMYIPQSSLLLCLR